VMLECKEKSVESRHTDVRVYREQCRKLDRGID